MSKHNNNNRYGDNSRWEGGGQPRSGRSNWGNNFNKPNKNSDNKSKGKKNDKPQYMILLSPLKQLSSEQYVNLPRFIHHQFGELVLFDRTGEFHDCDGTVLIKFDTLNGEQNLRQRMNHKNEITLIGVRFQVDFKEQTPNVLKVYGERTLKLAGRKPLLINELLKHQQKYPMQLDVTMVRPSHDGSSKEVFLSFSSYPTKKDYLRKSGAEHNKHIIVLYVHDQEVYDTQQHETCKLFHVFDSDPQQEQLWSLDKKFHAPAKARVPNNSVAPVTSATVHFTQPVNMTYPPGLASGQQKQYEQNMAQMQSPNKTMPVVYDNYGISQPDPVTPAVTNRQQWADEPVPVLIGKTAEFYKTMYSTEPSYPNVFATSESVTKYFPAGVALDPINNIDLKPPGPLDEKQAQQKRRDKPAVLAALKQNVQLQKDRKACLDLGLDERTVNKVIYDYIWWWCNTPNALYKDIPTRNWGDPHYEQLVPHIAFNLDQLFSTVLKQQDCQITLALHENNIDRKGESKFEHMAAPEPLSRQKSSEGKSNMSISSMQDGDEKQEAAIQFKTTAQWFIPTEQTHRLTSPAQRYMEEEVMKRHRQLLDMNVMLEEVQFDLTEPGAETIVESKTMTDKERKHMQKERKSRRLKRQERRKAGEADVSDDTADEEAKDNALLMNVLSDMKSA